jgi:hypothetical protein
MAAEKSGYATAHAQLRSAEPEPVQSWQMPRNREKLHISEPVSKKYRQFCQQFGDGLDRRRATRKTWLFNQGGGVSNKPSRLKRFVL